MRKANRSPSSFCVAENNRRCTGCIRTRPSPAVGNPIKSLTSIRTQVFVIILDVETNEQHIIYKEEVHLPGAKE